MGRMPCPGMFHIDPPITERRWRRRRPGMTEVAMGEVFAVYSERFLLTDDAEKDWREIYQEKQ